MLRDPEGLTPAEQESQARFCAARAAADRAGDGKGGRHGVLPILSFAVAGGVGGDPDRLGISVADSSDQPRPRGEQPHGLSPAHPRHQAREDLRARFTSVRNLRNGRQLVVRWREQNRVCGLTRRGRTGRRCDRAVHLSVAGGAAGDRSEADFRRGSGVRAQGDGQASGAPAGSTPTPNTSRRCKLCRCLLDPGRAGRSCRRWMNLVRHIAGPGMWERVGPGALKVTGPDPDI